MRHIFTTTRNSWLMQGLREALQEDGTEVQHGSCRAGNLRRHSEFGRHDGTR
ncbi:hypothetical protein AA419_004860 [Salmonella enterica subsp. enterica serovar Oslo]|nr:hypothetical protein [Salmonella enterica subsp. enterica serovar Oslo]ELM3433292.1 hypothetical protein [Salmonella enterica]